MKTTTLVTLSTALLLLADCALAGNTFDRPVYPPSTPMPQPSVRYVDRLVVNAENVERTVAKNKCESQGIREIVELMKRERFEELWLFLPETCSWIEIGRHVTSGPDEATIRVDRTYLTKAMVNHKELHLYHFHPLVYFERCKDKARCDQFSLPIVAGQISQQGLISNLRYSMPSAEDIYFMMDVSWEFDQRRDGDGRIMNSVVTPYGVLSYALTDAGEKKFFEERSLRTGGLYIKLTAANALLDEQIDSIIKKHPNDTREAYQQLIQSLNNKFIRITYTPL
jgi:hypothetical protein